ncbi:MAG: hypothetical protein IJ714_01450 [Bacteroidales bacterium]|nr:hypothetical protein [Bacteroidales bacterium]
MKTVRSVIHSIRNEAEKLHQNSIVTKEDMVVIATNIEADIDALLILLGNTDILDKEPIA